MIQSTGISLIRDIQKDIRVISCFSLRCPAYIPDLWLHLTFILLLIYQEKWQPQRTLQHQRTSRHGRTFQYVPLAKIEWKSGRQRTFPTKCRHQQAASGMGHAHTKERFIRRSFAVNKASQTRRSVSLGSVFLLSVKYWKRWKEIERDFINLCI